MPEPTDEARSERLPPWARRLILAVALGAIALVLIVRFFLSPAAAGDGKTCGLSGPTAVADVEKPGVLLPAENERVNFQWVYGADETVHRQTSLFLWRGPTQRPRPLKVGDRLDMRFPAPLEDSDKSESVPEEQMSANAVVNANGVLLSVCIDTSGVRPGRYVGAVVFDDPEISAAPFAIDVTVRNRAEWIPVAAIIAGIGLALMLLILNFANSPSSPEAKLLVVGVAVLTFVVGFTPWKAWQDDPSWGKGHFDWLPLAAATALAFLGGVQAGNTIEGARAPIRRSANKGAGPSGPPMQPASSPASTTPQQADRSETGVVR